MGIEDAFGGVRGGSVGCSCVCEMGLVVNVPELIGVFVPLTSEEHGTIVSDGAIVFGESGGATGVAELTNRQKIIVNVGELMDLSGCGG